MIRNQWYVIMDPKEVGKSRPVSVKRMGQKMVLWRDTEGKLACIADRCCHRGASLGLGKIKEGMVQCPFHGFRYDAQGKVRVIPAQGWKAHVADSYRVQAYTVVEKFGWIWLWWGDPRADLPEPLYFDDLKEGYAYSTFQDPWNIHYTRAIENQLDVVHLPFVHTDTIGKGCKTLVHGPVVKREGQLIRFFVHNVVDDEKTKAQKPSEIQDYEKLFQLQFMAPNCWQNMISDQVRISAAFVPVDEENTVVYIRFYQSFMKLPILRDLVGWLSKPMNRKILHQDKRVVMTQEPRKTSLSMDEKLIQGDLPIVEYRKLREELMGNRSED